jgi:RsmE family RNA methyltransferase
MNLLLLEDGDFLPDGTVRLGGRRLTHAREVLKAMPDDILRVGKLGGLCGTARVLADDALGLHLAPSLTEAPPARAGIDLILAIPRPKALKKILPAIASLGVDRLLLINAARVEKSFFDSKVLNPEYIGELFRQGLEQSRDTVLPELSMRPLFRPFVEDDLPTWARPGSSLLVLHPGSDRALTARAPKQHVTLAIGPDGGWVPFEIDLLTRAGFQSVNMGARILRTEVAIPSAVGTIS